MDNVVPPMGGDTSEDSSREPALLSEPQEEFDLLGEPELLPRIGDEYQASLPELLSMSEYLKQLRCEVSDKEVANNISSSLPLPFTRIQSLPDSHACVAIDSEGKVSSTVDEKCTEKSGLIPVQGGSHNPWMETEEEIFLLGLYIFGRNFFLLKKFVGANNIGEILSHYYGKFYRSERYQTWVDCRKARGRKCAYGLKIFMGSRQQELLSRLLPQLSEEAQNRLLEVTDTFSWGKMLLEEYVMTLKDLVGLHNLVEAVGIGKGKKDVTRNRATHIQQRWSTKREYSALSPEEILTYLRGRERLSKARCNDLFWEAVWPRLLAKGWHSEQPRNGHFSKEYLVFLMPGVKKFSRRHLTKGQHYFDCVRDVLNKIVSDPGIIYLTGESGEGYEVNEAKSEQEKSTDKQQRSFLKPRTQSSEVKEEVTFTIIDTTLVNGKTRKLRALRTLPVEPSSVQFGIHLVDGERTHMELETNSGIVSCKSNYLAFNMVEANVNVIEKKESPVKNAAVDDCYRAIKTNRDGCDDKEGKPAVKCKSKPHKKPDEKHSSAPEGRKRRKMNFSSEDQIGGSIAAHKETEEETICQLGTMVIEKENIVIKGENEMLIDSLDGAVQSNQQKSNEDEGKAELHCQQRTQKKLNESSCKGLDGGKRRKILKFSSDSQMGRCSSVVKEMNPEFETEESKSCSGTSMVENESTGTSCENYTDDKTRPQLLLDLNLPPPQDPEIIDSVKSMKQYDQPNKQDCVPTTANANLHLTISERQPTTSARRHSGRNRLMSARAVESLASNIMAKETRRNALLGRN